MSGPKGKSETEPKSHQFSRLHLQNKGAMI
jgi:hypothetical protein